MCLNLQIRYVVDSWVEFVSRRKALTTHESKETGHYICYKYVNGILLRFDDALVNRVDLLCQYSINLIMYRWYDIDPHKWEIDLGFVTHLNQVTYGLRHPPIQGTRYLLCHRDITEDERNPNGSIIAEKANTDNVGNSGEQPLDMTSKEQDTITTTLTSQEEPVDMTLSRQNVAVNRTDNTDPKNLEQCDDILTQSNQLEQPADTNLSPVDIEGNEESVPNIPQEDSTSEQIDPARNVDSAHSQVNNEVSADIEGNEESVPNIPQEDSTSEQIDPARNVDSAHSQVNNEVSADIEGNEESVPNIPQEDSTSEQIDPARNVDSGTSEVNNEVTLDENGAPNISEEQTVQSMSQSQLSGDSEKNDKNSLEKTTPETPNSKEGEIENSSPKAVDCSTEVDS